MISTLEITATGANFSLHPLIQDWIKLRSDMQDQRHLTIEAIDTLAVYIASQSRGNLTFHMRQIMLLHLTASIQNLVHFLDHHNEGIEGTPVLIHAMHNFAWFYINQGLQDEAEIMLNWALAGKEKIFGQDHTSTLETVSILAYLYRRQGRLSEAELISKQALIRVERMLEPDHGLKIRVSRRLADVYSWQGLYTIR